MFFRTMTATALAMLLVAPAAQAAAPTTDEEKTLYAIGSMLSAQLASFELTSEQFQHVQAGLTDGVLGNEPKVDIQAQGPAVQAFAAARAEAAAAKEKKAGDEFLASAATEPGAEKSDSGLVYIEMTPGDGAQPKATDSVTVHYVGTLIDGTEFDSSVSRGTPATFPLNRVIPCWTEGVQKMKVGGKSKLICPAAIAYGDRGSPPKIRPGATLQFEVELLSIDAAKEKKNKKEKK